MGCLLTATLLSRWLRDGIKIKSDEVGWKFLGKVGICSYSLYLLHQPLLASIPTAWLTPYGTFAKLIFLGFAALGILLLSWLSYIAIEVPGVKLGKMIIKTLKPRTAQVALN
jgi:peptidoglycan/LPS O-acetylase OafA/YrhL